jgi:hypothetical protein
VEQLNVIWFFIAHCVLLIGLFVWLDRRQTERYNLFAHWTQSSLMVWATDVARQIDSLPSDVVTQFEVRK